MKDFQQSVVYQIYPKSFRDTNGDGWGDLAGITEKLDYLQKLGVDYLWITPFFPSPQNDNGYDVADYRAVDPRYGTMEDFETLVAEAKARGIGIMLDMVFNHTSTSHEWFQKALAGDPAYQDYYIFRPGKGDGAAGTGPGAGDAGGKPDAAGATNAAPGAPPTNWESKFGGNAWEYVPSLGKYYLHLFDKTQADLNWENPAVRREVADIVRFWMDKGVRGFRFDVVNLISKGEFTDDFDGDGRRFYTDGPRVHEFLQELNRESFGREEGMITVGEMSSTSMENCFRYANEDGKEFSMVFSFHHLKVDFVGNEKWVLVPTDFEKLKHLLFSWQEGMAEHGAWNALFWCNHDQPRVVSRFGDDGALRVVSAKMLATVIHAMRGTPYIYQGEELGMTNPNFTRLDQYRDVESINHFHILRDQGMTETAAHSILQVHSRDNSRTPMQWTAEARGGFTSGEPWISVNPNTASINAESQVEDPNSIYSYYQKLVQLRKAHPVIADGDFTPLTPEHPQVIAYQRSHPTAELLCVNNFYRKECTWESPVSLKGYRVLLSNYDDCTPSEHWTLRPYEAAVLLREA